MMDRPTDVQSASERLRRLAKSEALNNWDAEAVGIVLDALSPVSPETATAEPPNREDYRIMCHVANEMGGIVQAVTEIIGIRQDACRDEIVARLRELLRAGSAVPPDTDEQQIQDDLEYGIKHDFLAHPDAIKAIFADAKAAVPDPPSAPDEPTLEQLTNAAQDALDVAVLSVMVLGDDGEVLELSRLVRCLDKAGLIDWAGVDSTTSQEEK